MWHEVWWAGTVINNIEGFVIKRVRLNKYIFVWVGVRVNRRLCVWSCVEFCCHFYVGRKVNSRTEIKQNAQGKEKRKKKHSYKQGKRRIREKSNLLDQLEVCSSFTPSVCKHVSLLRYTWMKKKSKSHFVCRGESLSRL